MDGFHAFWQAYPRKVAKQEAQRAWLQVDGETHLAAILLALEWQRHQAGWLKDGGQYVPHPATYLRARRWEDEPSEQTQVTGKTARTLEAAARWAQR